MTRQELHGTARRQPFVPFRVILTTGATYDIRHPDLIMVGQRSAVVGLPRDPERTFYDGTILVDLLHIVGVEMLPVTPASGNGSA
jgi:hypothetical protein